MNAVLAKRAARSGALRINEHAAKLILDLAAGRLIERRDRADKALAKKPNANRIHAEWTRPRCPPTSQCRAGDACDPGPRELTHSAFSENGLGE